MKSPEAPLEFKIHGMDCAEEVSVLKREVGPVIGGERFLAFDILNGKMTVLPQAPNRDANAILAAVARTGMKAEPWRGSEQAAGSLWQRRGRALMTAVSGVSLVAAFWVHAWLAGGVMAALVSEGTGIPITARILYGLAIVTGGWFIVPKAWVAARRLRPDMNLLMTIAVAGAVGIGEWFEAATVAFLFALSLLLESWSVARARRAVEALMDLAAPLVRVRREDGSEEELPPEAVQPGTRFIVRPGEKIPLDGRIVSGTSEVNQAPITGESQPVAKEPGEEVFAGTINGSGVLEVVSTRPAADTTLAHIIRLVEEAQSHRAPAEQWVERFARIYTPAIIGLAVAVLIAPPVLFGAPWEDWIYRSLVLLVIGCPCALVISTPVSIVAALAASARNGVLVKGGLYMEEPARLRALALDKTGTLTEGRPAVVEVIPLNGHTETEVLERAAALETRSEHPLARAIVEYAGRHGIVPKPAEDLQAIPGKGATARLDGRTFWLGSHRYLHERDQETPGIHERLEALSGAGRTVVIFGNDTHVCGMIALADTVRPEARPAIEILRRLGIRHIAMLTGDNEPTARAIAREIGIDEVYAELLPADKVRTVEKLVEKYGHCGMVGDGINDAPAMGRASVGIAMGAAGSDAAIEAADIALMSDDLSKLPWLVAHSRRTLFIIRQNIALSIAIKALFVVLTFAGHASLWAAIAADMGVSLLVISNALRLLRRG